MVTRRVLIVGADVGVIAREGYEVGGPFMWATEAAHLGALTKRPDRVVWATAKGRLPADLVAGVERLVGS